MFNRTTKQIVMDRDQLESFVSIIDTIQEKCHFWMAMTVYDTPLGETIVICKFTGISKRVYETLLLKLNKYGVKVTTA